MTLRMSSRPLYTDEDLNFERVFEVRIIDLRKRCGVKQKSFSISVRKGTKDKDYLSADELKKILKKSLSR